MWEQGLGRSTVSQSISEYFFLLRHPGCGFAYIPLTVLYSCSSTGAHTLHFLATTQHGVTVLQDWRQQNHTATEKMAAIRAELNITQI